MSRPTTSFQKKPRGGKRIEIPGTKPSIHNNQLLISTGIPSLDYNLGGGVAVGTLMLIEEDLVGSFSKLILRYFIAEGITSNHGLLLAAKDPSAILRQIPEPIVQDGSSGSMTHGSYSHEKTSTTTKGLHKPVVADDDRELKIAWRYEDVNHPDEGGVASHNKFGHYFDLSRNVDASIIDDIDKKIVDLSDMIGGDDGDDDDGRPRRLSTDCDRVMKECVNFLEKGKNFVTSDLKPEERKICRIVVHAAGSPLWNSSDPFSLPKFFFCLKNLLRRSFACAIVTVPSEIWTSSMKNMIVKSLQHLADYAVKLKSFAGTDDADNPALKDYDGFFHLVKLPRLNSLTRFTPSTFDLAFKLKRKRFTIEKLHLPPDMAETQEREQDETTTTVKTKTKKKAMGFGGGCGGMTGGDVGNLDF